MNAREASRTAPHFAPMELETSRTSDRSTMRRIAWLELAIWTSEKFPIFMNVVGSVAVALMSTMLTPEAASVESLKKFGSAVGSVDEVVPR